MTFQDDVPVRPYNPAVHRMILWSIALGAFAWNCVAAVMPPQSGVAGMRFMASPKPLLIAGLVALLGSRALRRVFHQRATSAPTGGERMAASVFIVASAEVAAVLGGVAIFLYQDPAISLVAVPWLLMTVIKYSPRS